jgi:hypothetical protein
MRELFEEVFGGDEVRDKSRRLCADWYERTSPPMQWLRQHRGAFEIVMTGFGISLLTGSATFDGVLAVREVAFWEDFGHEVRTNWEVTESLSPLVSTKDPDLWELISKRDWTDYSFQSMVEGLLYLKEISPERVALPNIVRHLTH